MRTLVRNFEPTKTVNSFPALFDTLLNNMERIERPSSVKTSPMVNVVEDENNFIVQMAAPGLKREDFKISVHEDIMTISSERTEESGENKSNFTRKEFSYSSFKRSFNLPETVDGDNIAANYTDGILSVTLPKKEEAKPKEPKQIAVA